MKPTERILKILDCLYANVLEGKTNQELSDTLKTSKSNICRDLEELIATGWVKKEENKFCLTTKPLALVKNYEVQMANYQQKINEMKLNVNTQALSIRSEK